LGFEIATNIDYFKNILKIHYSNEFNGVSYEKFCIFWHFPKENIKKLRNNDGGALWLYAGYFS
jgi:hypothetical protein